MGAVAYVRLLPGTLSVNCDSHKSNITSFNKNILYSTKVSFTSILIRLILSAKGSTNNVLMAGSIFICFFNEIAAEIYSCLVTNIFPL